MNLEYYRHGKWWPMGDSAQYLGSDDYWAGFMGDKAGTVRFRWTPTADPHRGHPGHDPNACGQPSEAGTIIACACCEGECPFAKKGGDQ